MKIGIEGQYLFKEHKYGIDIAALELIKRLQKIDTQNDYVIFVQPGMDNACLLESMNFKIVELKAAMPLIWEQISLPKAAQTEQCDILHCTTNTAPVNSKIPLVVTIQDNMHLKEQKLKHTNFSIKKKLQGLYKARAVPRALKEAKAIITYSEHEKQRLLKQYRFNNQKVKAIHPGISNKFTQIKNPRDLESFRAKYKLPKHFLFAQGSSDPNKNTVNVLKAYKHYCSKNKTVPLVLLDYNIKHLTKILKSIHATHLSDQIVLTKYVINSDLPAIYNLADVFLYPTFYDSFSQPVLEAMASGTPVITTKNPSVQELAADTVYYANPGKPEDISLGIYRLLTNHKLRNKNIESGLAKAEKFSLYEMANNTLDVYREIACDE